MELSLEGFVKIGWDNTPKDTKSNILVGDLKGAIADRLGRLIKIHFIGDGYFKGNRVEKAREYAQALFSLELRSICAVDEYFYWFRKYFFQSGVATEENQVSQEKGGSKVVTPTPFLGEPFHSGDYGGPCPKLEHINLDRERDHQGAKGHISPGYPQKRGELRNFEATDDILDAVYYGDLVPIYQFQDLPLDESVYEEEIETDSDESSIESEELQRGR
ncbi:UNVERIFIED_CONTAM: hypothetical protein Sindi_2891800 [Sesamum indicum]